MLKKNSNFTLSDSAQLQYKSSIVKHENKGDQLVHVNRIKLSSFVFDSKIKQNKTT